MDVRCEKCSTEYEFDENRVGASGVTVKCTACGHVFKVGRPRRPLSPRATTTLGKGPQGREWLVRKPDGQMIAFRELTTLQKWIVEGRINRDDEISKNGETWKRLGNILELEPFFSVYEKAQALNDLIERGGGRPLELRGSEVLSSASPLGAAPDSPRGPSAASPSGPVPAVSPDLAAGPRGAEDAAAMSTAAYAAAKTIPGGPLPPPPSAGGLDPSIAVPRLPSPNGFGAPGTGSMRALSPPPSPPYPTAPGTSGSLDAMPPPVTASDARAPLAPPMRASSLGASSIGSEARGAQPLPRAPSLGSGRHDAADGAPARPPSTGLEARGAQPHARAPLTPSDGRAHALPSRPAAEPYADSGLEGDAFSGSGPALRSGAQAALPRDPLTIPIDETGSFSQSDVVARFERQARLRMVLLGTGIIVVLGVAGGVAFARFGPSNNPLKSFAERHGLFQPRSAEDGASRPIEEAQRAFDLDTLESLEKAETLLAQADKIRPEDPGILSDRALAMITRGDALRRLAFALGNAADEAERIHEDWQAEVKQANDAKQAGGDKAGDDKPLPPEPKVANASALRAEMNRASEVASHLLKQAFDIAATGYKLAPDSFAPARALAEYYRVQQDLTSYNRELARARGVMDKSGAMDAALLYTEAAAQFTLKKPRPDDLARSAQLLEQALTTRPSMNRARVLLARVRIEERKPGPARTELERVLAVAPEHQEAKRLLEGVGRLEKELAPPETKTEAAAPEAARPGGDDKPAPAKTAETVKPKSAAEAPADRAAKNASRTERAERAEPTERGKSKSAYDQMMSLADRHRERDRPRQALQTYEKASDLRPTSAEPLAGMGWAYIDLDNPQAALYAFKRALKVNDRYADAYYGQAEALRQLGNTQEAIRMYEQYLSRSPGGADRKAAERALEQLKR